MWDYVVLGKYLRYFYNGANISSDTSAFQFFLSNSYLLYISLLLFRIYKEHSHSLKSHGTAVNAFLRLIMAKKTYLPMISTNALLLWIVILSNVNMPYILKVILIHKYLTWQQVITSKHWFDKANWAIWNSNAKWITFCRVQILLSNQSTQRYDSVWKLQFLALLATISTSHLTIFLPSSTLPHLHSLLPLIF